MNADKIKVVKIALNIRMDATTPPSPTRPCLPGKQESSRDLTKQSTGSPKSMQTVYEVPTLYATAPSSIRQLQQGVQQHIGAVFNQIPLSEFSG